MRERERTIHTVGNLRTKLASTMKTEEVENNKLDFIPQLFAGM